MRRQRMWRNSARHAHHAREQRSATAASSLEFNVDVKDSRAGRRAAQTHAHQERQHGNKWARARPGRLARCVPGAQTLACSMPHASSGLQAGRHASTRVGDARHACTGPGCAEQRPNSLVALTIGLGLRMNEATLHLFFLCADNVMGGGTHAFRTLISSTLPSWRRLRERCDGGGRHRWAGCAHFWPLWA